MVAVVLTLFVGVGVFLSWRATPDRFRSAVTVQMPTPVGSDLRGSGVKPADPYTARASRPALDVPRCSRPTSHPTRPTSASAPPEPRVASSGSRRPRRRRRSPALSRATGLRPFRTPARTTRADGWQRRRRALNRKVVALHRELVSIDKQLVKVDPAVYHGLLDYDSGIGGVLGAGAGAPPPVPENGTSHEFNLAFERIQILNTLRNSANQSASMRITAPGPEVSTKVVAQTPATNVATTPPAAVPGLVTWLIALTLVLAVALLVYHLRTHAPPRRPVASRLGELTRAGEPVRPSLRQTCSTHRIREGNP